MSDALDKLAERLPEVAALLEQREMAADDDRRDPDLGPLYMAALAACAKEIATLSEWLGNWQYRAEQADANVVTLYSVKAELEAEVERLERDNKYLTDKLAQVREGKQQAEAELAEVRRISDIANERWKDRCERREAEVEKLTWMLEEYDKLAVVLTPMPFKADLERRWAAREEK